jgi:hypothetical protein
MTGQSQPTTSFPLSGPGAGAAPKRKLPHSKKAAQQGVSARTLDRWIAAGIIDPPVYIHGRKYHDEDSQPRCDQASPKAA